MNAAERAEHERQELLRAMRYAATALRIMDAQAEAEARARELCEMRLRERRQQLEFSI